MQQGGGPSVVGMKTPVLLALFALVSTSGCVVHAVRPGHRLPPPPAGRVVRHQMGYEEAVSRAHTYAQQRGFRSHVERAHLTGNGVWKVRLHVERPGQRGQLRLELDSYARTVVRAQERLKNVREQHVHGASPMGRGRGRW
jgi:hypothetical protein